MATLTYERLQDAVAGSAVALRSRTTLTPAGGPGSKVAPPTYGEGGAADTRYALEDRRVNGSEERVALLDSVASQANRLELALLEAWEAGELAFPVAYVDFTKSSVADLDRITVLEAPHRIADAIFRDSLYDGTLFRLSDAGRAITEAHPRAATALLHYCPTALLFGMWDSTGPKGGLGAKFQRAIVSEVVGYAAQTGVATASRIDPLAIEKEAATIYKHRDPTQEWTLEEGEAEKDKDGKPVLFQRRGTKEDKGRPSMINHGNVMPSINKESGGVTIERAEQILVLSFAALRRLKFPLDMDGAAVDRDRRRDVEIAARTAVAALGTAAVAYQYELDFDLRSRCLLVPEHPPRMEMLTRNGSKPETVDLDREAAQTLVQEASTALSDVGLGWHEDELRLEPAPKLVQLIEHSRDLSRSEATDDGDE